MSIRRKVGQLEWSMGRMKLQEKRDRCLRRKLRTTISIHVGTVTRKSDKRHQRNEREE